MGVEQQTDYLSDTNLNSDILENNSLQNSASELQSGAPQDSEVRIDPVPLEFTEDDREIQKILSELENPTDEIYFWMSGLNPPEPTDPYKFILPGRDSYSIYYRIPENSRQRENSPFEIPTTLAGMKEIMLKYFSAERTEKFLKNFGVFSAVENSDGSYTLTLDSSTEYKKTSPIFVEVDGKLYRDDGASTSSISIDSETAKVVRKTDSVIEFTYLFYHYDDWEPNTKYRYEPLYSQYAKKGILKYEMGGWKLDDWNLPNS